MPHAAEMVRTHDTTHSVFSSELDASFEPATKTIRIVTTEAITANLSGLSNFAAVMVIACNCGFV